MKTQGRCDIAFREILITWKNDEKYRENFVLGGKKVHFLNCVQPASADNFNI